MIELFAFKKKMAWVIFNQERMLKDIYFHRKEGQGDPKVCPFFRKRPFNCT